MTWNWHAGMPIPSYLVEDSVGNYSLTSQIVDGIIIGTPNASFDEEMEGMIAFAGGVIDTDTLYHENMHQ